MAEYVKRGNTTLGIALRCARKSKARSIITTSIDGTPYAQTTGDPEIRREVSVYCETLAKREAMDDARNEAAVVTVTWQGVTYYGFVENDINWQEFRDGHGVGSFNLLVKEVV